MSTQLQIQRNSGYPFVFQAQTILEPQFQGNQVTMAPMALQPAGMHAIFN